MTDADAAPLDADTARVDDRILFGSDYPNIPHPYGEALDALARLGLGEEWLRAVCHHNAARLFALD